MVEVSHAGAMATLEVSGPWMSHVGIDALAELEGDARVQIEKGWSRAALPGVPEVGDRRQEVVFIGQGLQVTTANDSGPHVWYTQLCS